MSIVSDIGARIRDYRLRRDMTQLEVAMKLSAVLNDSVSQNLVSCWETGTRRIYAEQICGLAKVFQCTPYALLNDGRHSPTRLLSEVDNLPYRSKEIMHFAATDWTGDTLALIENLLVYMRLPPDRRRRSIEYELFEYEEAYRNNQLDPTVPTPDIEYLRKKCDQLGRKSK